MRKKSILEFGMCFILILSLAACKKNDNQAVSKTEPEVTETVESTEAEDSQSTKTAEETEATQKETTNSSQFIACQMEKKGTRYYDQESGQELCKYSYDVLHIHSDEAVELKKAIEQHNEERTKNYDDLFAEMTESAKLDFQDRKEWWESLSGAGYVMQSDSMIRRSDQRILSFLETCYSYTGGANGTESIIGYNYNAATGEKITLSDLMNDIEGLPDLLEEKLLEEYDPEIFLEEDLSQYIQETYQPFASDSQLELQFTADYTGITFYFGEMDIANHAAGKQMVSLSYQDHQELLKAEYFSDVPQDYVLQLQYNDENKIEIDPGQGLQTISFYGEMEPDYDDCIMALTVGVNDIEVKNDTHTFLVEPYYICSDGHHYLYIETMGESDYRTIMIYEIQDGKPVYVNEITGTLIDFVDPACFKIENRSDALSTYGVYRMYHIGEDGIPVNDGEEYEADQSEDRRVILKSTVELTGELIEPDTDESLGEGTFPAGTEFTLWRTDNKTYVITKASDGRTVKFQITMDWPQTINGMDAEDCFEQLWFAS